MPMKIYLALMLGVILAAGATVSLIVQFPANALAWSLPLFAAAAWLAHRYRG